MPFCKNCGASVSGQFCPQCGTPMAAPAGGAPQGQPTPPPAAPAQAPPQGYYAAAPQPAPAAAAPGLQDNVAALLSYTFIGAIIFLVVAPYNTKKFVRFHAFQGLFYWIGAMIVSFGYSIVVRILIRAIWSVTSAFGMLSLLGLVGTLLQLAFLAIAILLAVKAYQGQMYKLPIIGDLAEKQA